MTTTTIIERAVLISGLSVSAILAGGAACAAGIEEVVVTAQKREQDIQDVGISITALSGAQMREFRFTESTEITAQVPGVVSLSVQGKGANALTYIRGVGLNDFGDAHEAPVTGYVDEFYVLPPAALDFGLYDLERVEALRGPQGTLFGRNSTGGLVHYVTTKPTSGFSGYLDTSLASRDEQRVEAAINSPLGDNFVGRASFLYHDGGGYIENRGGFENGGSYGTASGRVQLLYTPRDDLDLLFKVQYGEVDNIPAYYDHTPAIVDPGTGLQVLDPRGVDSAGYNESQIGAQRPRVVSTDDPQWLKSEMLNALFRADWEVAESTTLTSLTGFLDFSRKSREDCDGSPNTLCAAGFPVDHEILTQELRLQGAPSNYNWTVGLYYLNQDASGHPSADIFGIPFFLNAPWDLELESYAAFGQIEFPLSSEVTLTLGGRYTRDEKFLEQTNRVNGAFRNDADNFTKLNVGDLTERTDDLVSANVNLDWKPTDGLLLYTRIARGTKAGGFNNGFYAAQLAEEVQFEDETLMSYEVGMKTKIFDGMGMLNIGAFYYDYDDFQTYNFQNLRGKLTNSDAENYGSEIELSLVPIDQLYLSLGVSLLDATIKDVDIGPMTVDRTMSMAPDYTVNGVARYSLSAFGGDIRTQMDFNYLDDKFHRNFNDPASNHGAQFLANLRFNYVSASAKWEFGLFVENLTDRANKVKATPMTTFNLTQAVYDAPRTYGGSIRYNWN